MTKAAVRGKQRANARPAASAGPRTAARKGKQSATLPGQAPKPASAGDDADVEEPPKRTGPKMRVRATALGYYDHTRRRPGDVFDIDATKGDRTRKVFNKKTGETDVVVVEKDVPLAFSEKWMEEVKKQTPLKTTTPNDAIAREHDTTLAMRHGGATSGRASDVDVSGDEDDD